MIALHHLNGQEFILNCDHIESLESTPDTMVLLTNGRKIVVKDSVNEVVARVIAYRKECGMVVRVAGVAKRENVVDAD